MRGINIILLTLAVVFFLATGKSFEAHATGAGNALDFDYDDDYVSVGDSASLEFSPSITVEAWIKADSFPTSYGDRGTVTATLVFDYSGQPGVVVPSGIEILKRDDANDTTWELVTETSRDDVAKTITITGVTSFSEYALGGFDPPNSLPVELSLFTATTSEMGVMLAWRTESEVNNVGFAIYRSDAKDGKYTKIGWRDGAGSSAMPHDYHFLDKQVEVGKTYFYYIEDVDIAGERNKSDIIQITVTPRPQTVIPAKFALLQNYPNPFNPETWVPYQLAKDAHVTIITYNAKGQAVRILNLGNQKAGEYIVRSKAAYWDGRNDLGEKVASGVYFYTLKAGEFSATRKMLIVK